MRNQAEIVVGARPVLRLISRIPSGRPPLAVRLAQLRTFPTSPDRHRVPGQQPTSSASGRWLPVRDLAWRAGTHGPRGW